MTKYRETLQKMLSDNKELFDEFKEVHDRYALNMDGLQNEFNEVGKKAMKTIREYENRLCLRSESNGYAYFTGNLAQKFMDEVRKLYPHIDRVGIIVTKKAPEISIPQLKPRSFSLKKITLN